jgi:hypothetical protein
MKQGNKQKRIKEVIKRRMKSNKETETKRGMSQQHR